MMRRKILIVLDENLDLTLEDSFLERRSLAVRTAMSREHALAITEMEHPHVVVFSALPTGAAAGFCEAVRAKAGVRTPDLVAVLPQEGPALQEATQALRTTAGLHVTEVGSLLAELAELVGVRSRGGPRVAVYRLAHVVASHEEQPRRGMVGNILSISVTGMRVELGEPVSVGDELDVSFFLPEPHARIELRCLVREVVDASSLCYGVAFTTGQVDATELIAKFVATRQNPRNRSPREGGAE